VAPTSNAGSPVPQAHLGLWAIARGAVEKKQSDVSK
jgi:hypothetical protein